MVTVKVNGQEHTFDGDTSMPLLWVLRDELGLTGTKFGCGLALCGACTVHVDGRPVRSCMTPVGFVDAKAVTTIEAMADDRVGKVLQEAWVDLQVPQCGYCQSGQIMTATALLTAKTKPSD